MKVLSSLMLAAMAATALVLAGCGDENAMMSRESSLVARTVPSSGETSYDPAAPIHIMFNSQMDTARFHERFFFLEADMHDGMHDSLDQGMMSDSSMAVCDSMARGMMGGETGGMGGMMGGRHGDMNRNGSGFDMMDPMMMSMMNNDGHMMDTASFYRGIHDRGQRGRFEWNDARDSCVFTPDSPMMGGRDYVIMMRSMGRSMHDSQSNGMMDDGAEDIMITFRTR